MNSEFKEKIHDKKFRVGVIGLGYVGIPLFSDLLVTGSR